MTLSVCVSVTASTTRPRWPRGRSKSRFTLPDKYNRSSQERVPTVHRTGNRNKNCITHVRHAVIKHTLAYSITRKRNCNSVGASETAPVRFLRRHLSVSWPPPIATRADDTDTRIARSTCCVCCLLLCLSEPTQRQMFLYLVLENEARREMDWL